MKGSDAEDLCAILMSHDPTHWEEEVMNGKAPIELTLSGHTHGMQFGIEIPWLGINGRRVNGATPVGLVSTKRRVSYFTSIAGLACLGFMDEWGCHQKLQCLKSNRHKLLRRNIAG
jgi:hypothetical protein